MSKVRSHKPGERSISARRQYTREFKEEAVRMVLDGHAVASVCQRLGLTSPSLLYNWKRKLVEQGGTAAVGLEARVRELEAELRRVEQERDILKKALAIFGRER
jgi:transposase